ncbi:MAG: ArsR family transcriptional regulator [Verrucomicrobiales bacterium]|nr:ArsR family transcriptional regulator [Verrucomicrobiales bacterium]
MNTLSPVTEKFVLHWGEMGARWGINRTMAQIHALLFVSEKPLHAEEICEVLGLARSNVSTSLRELQNWGVVKVVHHMGDRRDHFETLKDVFEMFRTIAVERKRREMDPTLSALRECIAEADPTNSDDIYARQRMKDLEGFFEMSNSWFEKVSRMPAGRVRKAMKLGDQVFTLLGLTGD